MATNTVLAAALCLAALNSAANAAQTPKRGSLDRRVTSVVYQENNVVQVLATYGISTMIVLDEDERFQTISLGDTDSWQVVPAEKGNILFVKPIAKNVKTNMNIVTDKRIYYLELRDGAPKAGREVFAIRFIYPEKKLNAALRKEAEQRAAWPNISAIDKANLNIAYSFSGDARLKPSLVFDDGSKTFFQFDRRAPAIFAVNSDFTETLENLRREGDYIVVDGTARQFTLRDGDRWVCIFNLGKPDFGAPDPGVLGPVEEPLATERGRSGN